MNIQEALRRAKGSEVLPTVLIGMKNAEEWMIAAADHIDDMEAAIWELEGELEDSKASARYFSSGKSALQRGLEEIRDGFDGRGNDYIICHDCADKHEVACDTLGE